jgi:hypothetical protein
MGELPGGPGVFVFCDFHAGVGGTAAVRSRLHAALVRPEDGHISGPQGVSTRFTFKASVLGGNSMFDLAKELWLLLRVHKKFWLLPIIVIMGLFGTLLVFAQSTAIAPFIYTLF